MVLYDSPVSGNCYKVRLLLAHLGIRYERQMMDVIDRSNRPDVLGGLNPSLRVPTIVLDDVADSERPPSDGLCGLGCDGCCRGAFLLRVLQITKPMSTGAST